jgi:thymidine kinase
MLSIRDARHGRITTITGPVHSGKTTELERILKSARGRIWDGGSGIILAKHPMDDVSNPRKVVGYDAISTDNPDEIAHAVVKNTEAVVISGINFFTNPRIVDLVQSLALSNRRVYAAGHNLTWDSKPYNFMPDIMALSDEFVLTEAPCIERDCQLRATRSRNIDGKSERVCIDHHFFEGRPEHRPFLKRQTGGLELFVGSMFASKTTMWHQRMKELQANGIDYVVFKWVEDARYAERDANYSTFDNGFIGLNDSDEQIPAVVVRDAHDMLMYLECRTGIKSLDAKNKTRMLRLGHIFVDEGQFIKDLADVVRLRVYQGYKFYVTGLLRTWKMEPFGEMPRLLTIAERINVMHGYCEKCHRAASESQRFVRKDGSWVTPDYDERVIAIGGKEKGRKIKDKYEARCKDCVVIPGRPDSRYHFDRYEPPR